MFTCHVKVSTLWFIWRLVYKQFDVGMLEIMPIGLRMAFINSQPKNDQYFKGEWNKQNLKKESATTLFKYKHMFMKDIFLHLI